MSAATYIVAPTDAQLAYIASLCDERGIETLPVVYSKDDASRCIAAILAREYRPSDYAPPSAAPTYDDADYGGFANGTSAYDPDLGYDDPTVPF